MPRFIPLMCALLFMAMVPAKAIAQQLNEDDRNRYVNQIRAYKHDFLAKELGLSKAQQDAFFELYDAMEDRTIDLGGEVRDLEKKASAAGASDEEMAAAAIALYSQKMREGEIEIEYYEKFKETLTPAQLVALKSAERKFTQELMRQHRRLRGEKGARR